MDQWIHPNFRGGIPGGECKDLTLDMGLDIESAHVDGEAGQGGVHAGADGDGPVAPLLHAAQEELVLVHQFGECDVASVGNRIKGVRLRTRRRGPEGSARKSSSLLITYYLLLNNYY